MRTMTAMVGGIALLGAGAVTAADDSIRSGSNNELGPYYLEGMFDHYFADVVPDLGDRRLETAPPAVGDVGEGILTTEEDLRELGGPYGNEHMVSPYFGSLGISYQGTGMETAPPAVGAEGAITEGRTIGEGPGDVYANEHMFEPYFTVR